LNTAFGLAPHTHRQLGAKADDPRQRLDVHLEGKCLPGAYANLIDNEFTMAHMHLVRLDAAHYPADASICSLSECVKVGDGPSERGRLSGAGEGRGRPVHHAPRPQGQPEAAAQMGTSPCSPWAA
jgi:hypothetical protein